MTAGESAILAVRHCASEGQAPEAGLTARGREQALHLADAIAGRHPVARIVSSPYRRARESIAPLASRLGLRVEIDERLAERRLSPVSRDDWREFVRRSFDDLDARAPGGESGREALARGWSALHDALASPGALIVSHGQLLGLVLHRIDAGFGYADWEAMANPDVFRIARTAGGGLCFTRGRLGSRGPA